jgi:hypothetical protein
MPSTIMSEFAEIAREYYWKSQQAKLQSSQMPMDPPSLPVTMMPEESTATQGMDQLPQQQVFAAPDGAFQMVRKSIIFRNNWKKILTHY